MLYSGWKSESVCCEHCFKLNNYWPVDLNNGNIHRISDCWHAVLYCDILNQIVNWFVSLYGWNKFSLINESEAGLAPNCYNELRSSHNHQMVMKCTWTRWPVGTELASCFSKNNVASGDTGLHKSKFLTLLHPLGEKKRLLSTAVFISRVLIDEIIACKDPIFSQMC